MFLSSFSYRAFTSFHIQPLHSREHLESSSTTSYRESHKAALHPNCRCTREFGNRTNQLPGCSPSPLIHIASHTHVQVHTCTQPAERRKRSRAIERWSVFSVVPRMHSRVTVNVYQWITHLARETKRGRWNSVRWKRKSELEHSTSRKSTTVAS